MGTTRQHTACHVCEDIRCRILAQREKESEFRHRKVYGEVYFIEKYVYNRLYVPDVVELENSDRIVRIIIYECDDVRLQRKLNSSMENHRVKWKTA